MLMQRVRCNFAHPVYVMISFKLYDTAAALHPRNLQAGMH